MKKIKVLGEFERIALYIPNSPELTGEFNTSIDALHTAVLDAYNNVKKGDIKAICKEVEVHLRDPNINTNFGNIVMSLEVVLDKGGRFTRRKVLENLVAKVRKRLDKHGKGPQIPVHRGLFESVTEAAVLDRTDYNDIDDLLIIIGTSQNTEGLVHLVRVLPYVNAQRTLIVETSDEWIEASIAPYFNGVMRVFERQRGRVVSVLDDSLLDALADLVHSAEA